MAKVKNYSGNGESMKSVWSNDGNKRYGFVSRDRRPDAQLPESRYTTRYGAGIDNLPLSGYSEREINTPLGTIDYGHDQDTAFAGFTPNFERTRDYYTNGQGNPWSMDYASSRLGDTLLQAGKYGNPANPNYFAGAFLPGDRQYIPDFDRNVNTPLGNLELQSNYDSPNTLDATLTPNARTNYYIQALANLLRGR